MSDYSAAVEDFLAWDAASGELPSPEELGLVQQAIRNLEANFANAQKGWDAQREQIRVAYEALESENALLSMEQRNIHSAQQEPDGVDRVLDLLADCIRVRPEGAGISISPDARKVLVLWQQAILSAAAQLIVEELEATTNWTHDARETFGDMIRNLGEES